MNGFVIEYKKIKFMLHRCIFQDNGATITHEFKVHKGVFTYDLGFDGVSVRPYNGDFDLLIYVQRGPWRKAQKREILNNNVNDALVDLVKQIMDRLEPEE